MEVTDRIEVQLLKDANLIDALAQNEAYVKTEVLANKIEWLENSFSGEIVEFEHVKTELSLKKSR